MDVLALMQEQVLFTGLPKSFKEDFTIHDTNRLRGDDPPPSFGWCLRECGTLLLDLRMTEGSLNDFILHLSREEGGSSPKAYYVWDGVELVRCGCVKAFHALCMNRRLPQNNPLYGGY